MLWYFLDCWFWKETPHLFHTHFKCVFVFSSSLLILLYFLDESFLVLLSTSHVIEWNFGIILIFFVPCYCRASATDSNAYNSEGGKIDKFFAFSTYMHMRGIAYGRKVMDLVGCCIMSYQIIAFHFTKLDSMNMLSIFSSSFGSRDPCWLEERMCQAWAEPCDDGCEHMPALNF